MWKQFVITCCGMMSQLSAGFKETMVYSPMKVLDDVNTSQLPTTLIHVSSIEILCLVINKYTVMIFIG